MSEPLLESDVRRIATYTRIGLADHEVTELTQDLNKIIESLKPITEYNLEGVEPTYHPIAGLTNVMREDVNEPSFTQEEALMNAPESRDGAFVVPAILGGGDE